MVAQVVRLATQLISTVLLARLLSPSDFGLFAMVVSIIGIGEILRDFGLSMAAVQAKTLIAEQKSNLFWVNTAIGGTLSIICFAAAEPIAGLYGDKQLTGIAQALSVSFLLNGISTQFRSEINRNLRFFALNVVDTAPQVFGLLVGVAVALVEQSYWALVAQQLAATSFGLLFSVGLAKWCPGFPNRTGDIRDMLRFGTGIFGTQAMAYVTKNADNIALGLYSGPAALGLYSRAYQLLMLPINQMTAPVSRVAIPILSRVSEEKHQFERYLKKGQVVGSLVAGLVFAFCAGMAEPLVLLVFGTEWEAMIPVFQILAVGGIFRTLNQISYWAFVGMGRPGSQFRLYLVTQPCLVVFMIAGLPWGAIGVASGHTIGYLLNWIGSLWWTGRVLDIRVKPLLSSALRGLFTVTLPVGLGTYGIAHLPLPSVVLLPISLGVVGVYLAVLRIFSAGLRSDLLVVAAGFKVKRKRVKSSPAVVKLESE